MKNSKPSKKQLRDFGLLVGFCFPFLIGWLLPFIYGHQMRLWTLFIGVPMILFGFFSPSNLKFFYRKWIDLGSFLGFINSYLILGIIFIVVMQPISLIMKLFGYDPLKLKKLNMKSYREFRKDDNINLEKIF